MKLQLQELNQTADKHKDMSPEYVLNSCREEINKMQTAIDTSSLKVQSGAGNKDQLLADLDAAMETCSEITNRLKVQVEQAETFKK